jgi:hypothetical protein
MTHLIHLWHTDAAHYALAFLAYLFWLIMLGHDSARKAREEQPKELVRTAQGSWPALTPTGKSTDVSALNANITSIRRTQPAQSRAWSLGS